MSDDLRSNRSARPDDDYLLWDSGMWGHGGWQDARGESRADSMVVHTVMVDTVTLEKWQEMTAAAKARAATGVKARPTAVPPGEGRGGRFLKSIFRRSYGRIYYPLIADAQRAWYFQEKPTWRITVRMWLFMAAHAVRQLAKSDWIGRITEGIARLLGI